MPPQVIRTYTIQRGDTLSLIAHRLLGNMMRWPELAKLNNIADPNLIKVGQVIRLPNGADAPHTDLPLPDQPDIPPPPESIPDITDPGTGKSALEVTAKRIPWLAIILVAGFFLLNEYTKKKR